MRAFGRAMQVFGLTALPLAMLLQLSQSLTLGQMLALLVAGVCAFYIGRIVEGYAPQ
jgi:hypothetical protein